MHTEAINHDPAITFCQTGHQLAGRPSMGAWLSYGLGTENKDLPAYVVLTSWGQVVQMISPCMIDYGEQAFFQPASGGEIQKFR